jgi:hypothetical protein
MLTLIWHGILYYILIHINKQMRYACIYSYKLDDPIRKTVQFSIFIDEGI